jgi:hypothetical protein
MDREQLMQAAWRRSGRSKPQMRDSPRAIRRFLGAALHTRHLSKLNWASSRK